MKFGRDARSACIEAVFPTTFGWGKQSTVWGKVGPQWKCLGVNSFQTTQKCQLCRKNTVPVPLLRGTLWRVSLRSLPSRSDDLLFPWRKRWKLFVYVFREADWTRSKVAREARGNEFSASTVRKCLGGETLRDDDSEMIGGAILLSGVKALCWKHSRINFKHTSCANTWSCAIP